MGRKSTDVTELVPNFEDLPYDQRIVVQEKQYQKQLIKNRTSPNKTLDEIIEKQIKEMEKKQKAAVKERSET